MSFTILAPFSCVELLFPVLKITRFDINCDDLTIKEMDFSPGINALNITTLKHQHNYSCPSDFQGVG